MDKRMNHIPILHILQFVVILVILVISIYNSYYPSLLSPLFNDASLIFSSSLSLFPRKITHSRQQANPSVAASLHPCVSLPRATENHTASRLPASHSTTRWLIPLFQLHKRLSNESITIQNTSLL